MSSEVFLGDLGRQVFLKKKKKGGKRMLMPTLIMAGVAVCPEESILIERT